jgi:hypothetical protein
MHRRTTPQHRLVAARAATAVTGIVAGSAAGASRRYRVHARRASA